MYVLSSVCVCVCFLCVFSPHLWKSILPTNGGVVPLYQKTTGQPKWDPCSSSGTPRRSSGLRARLCTFNRGTTTTTLPQPTLVKATGGYLVEWKLDAEFKSSKWSRLDKTKRVWQTSAFSRKSRWNPRGNIHLNEVLGGCVFTYDFTCLFCDWLPKKGLRL